MERPTLDKLARRARKALRHATRQALDATTEKSLKRHNRRKSRALATLASLDYDTRRHGLALD